MGGLTKLSYNNLFVCTHNFGPCRWHLWYRWGPCDLFLAVRTFCSCRGNSGNSQNFRFSCDIPWEVGMDSSILTCNERSCCSEWQSWDAGQAVCFERLNFAATSLHCISVGLQIVLPPFTQQPLTEGWSVALFPPLFVSVDLADQGLKVQIWVL